jgi:hypothetical protein
MLSRFYLNKCERVSALRMSGIALCQTRELRRVKTGVHTTSMIAIRRWLSAVVRIRSTPLADAYTAVAYPGVT